MIGEAVKAEDQRPFACDQAMEINAIGLENSRLDHLAARPMEPPLVPRARLDRPDVASLSKQACRSRVLLHSKAESTIDLTLDAATWTLAAKGDDR